MEMYGNSSTHFSVPIRGVKSLEVLPCGCQSKQLEEALSFCCQIIAV